MNVFTLSGHGGVMEGYLGQDQDRVPCSSPCPILLTRIATGSSLPYPSRQDQDRVSPPAPRPSPHVPWPGLGYYREILYSFEAKRVICNLSFVITKSTSDYRLGPVNSNTVNSKFHLIQTFVKIFATFLSFQS